MGLKVKCPKCNEDIEIEVPNELKNRESLIYLPVIHGDPPHVLVVTLSPDGKVYGTIVYETVLSFYSNVMDVINILGPKNFAKLIAAALTNTKVRVVAPNDFYSRVSSVLQYLNISLSLDENSPIIFDFLAKRFPKNIPGERYIGKILDKISDSKNPEEVGKKLREEILKIQKTLLDIEQFLKKIPERGINFIVLMTKHKVKDKDLMELIRAFLKNKGLDKKYFELKPF